jgi:hypothetical protein
MKSDQTNQTDRLHEQSAPLKNTDQAFVQVGKDGAPVIPEHTNTPSQEEKQDDERRHHS